MKKDYILKTARIFIIGIIIACLVQTAIYYLPVAPMQQHLQESIQILLEEGENPFLREGLKGSSLDNYTDAIMLGNAVYQTEMPTYKAALLVPRSCDEQEYPIESLQNYLNNEKGGEVTYPRYWHGYLAFLKPLLIFANYGEIRSLNLICMMLLVSICVWKFACRKMWRGCIAFVLSFFSLFPMAVSRSLQYSTIFYIGMISCLMILFRYEKMCEKGWMAYFFLINGMITSYMDFLTYPVYAFGIPAVLALCLTKEIFWGRFKQLMVYGIEWSIGYLGMWSSKWLIGSFALGNNLLKDAVGTIGGRISHEVNEEKISSLTALLRNGYIYFNKIGIFIWLCLALFLVFALVKYGNRIKKSSCWIMLLLAMIPAVWYCVVVNHSYVHYWYTFRGLAVTVFALGMMPEILYDEECGKGKA